MFFLQISTIANKYLRMEKRQILLANSGKSWFTSAQCCSVKKRLISSFILFGCIHVEEPCAKTKETSVWRGNSCRRHPRLPTVQKKREKNPEMRTEFCGTLRRFWNKPFYSPFICIHIFIQQGHGQMTKQCERCRPDVLDSQQECVDEDDPTN